MTLTDALRTATSSLSASSQQVSVLSRNIAGVGDPNYVRREANQYSGSFGTTRVETQRIVNQSVFKASTLANADAAKANAVATGIDRLALLQELGNFSYSPAKLLGDLQQAAEFAASSPSNSAALSSFVETARTVSSALNSASGEILSLRANADKEISNSVTNINALLEQLDGVNEQIVHGTKLGDDVFDNLDIRDEILTKLSDEIGISTVSRENNDIIVMTSNGVLLFEGRPRTVSFQPTPAYGPNTVGNPLIIDGVTTSGANATLPINSGKIAGNLELRDTVFVQQQNQLDEIARGLIDIFAEEDQTGGGKPKLAGLFTWSGGPTVPASGTLEPGIANSLSINPLVDPQAGGNTTLIRDGVINGDVDYLYNTNGGAGFSDRLFALASVFDTGLTFDPASNLPTNQSLTDFAASSLNWLNASRQSATNNEQFQTGLAAQFKESLQNETGPNLDFEMSRLLEVERAYQATAKLLTTVDEMLQTLLDSVR